MVTMWKCTICGLEIRGHRDAIIDAGWVKFEAWAGAEGKMERKVIVGCPAHRQEASDAIQAFIMSQ
jgi:hypothetical protein